MHLDITDYTSLQEIQDVFSAFYPYLKIEFYTKPHKKYEATEEASRLDSKLRVNDIKKTHVSGLLEILPMYKVYQVEKEFQERFGLSAQIFLKNNETWQQTTDMDSFTLKELNEMGRNSSDEFIVEDYEEGFEEPEEKPDKLY
ncbi:MAG: hypothetical protein JST87_04820 [Bacteroidetes bacterium]|nr:hypothetical protein [Bacteroidota bacterium]MBS1933423.1 hypothetical protein [Bacteroidota bacterium]